MTNESNTFYKTLRRVSFNECIQTKKETMPTAESNGMNGLQVVSLISEQPAKLTKSPRLRVCHFCESFKLFC